MRLIQRRIKVNKLILNNGYSIPSIGFGTWRAQENEAYNSTLIALQTGYRLIDTAQGYENEQEVGKAIKASNISREELFITSKLSNSIRGYNQTIESFNQSLKRLNLDYLDLFLIHWPNPIKYRDNYIKLNQETWAAFEDLYLQGKIKAIGVSNFMVKHLNQIEQTCKIKPMVNQILLFPGLTHTNTVNYCKNNNIVLQAYSPLGRPSLVNDERIINLSNKYNCTQGQLLLAYQINKGIIPLTKSIHQDRIISNFNSTSIILTKEDISYLDNLKLDEICQTEESIDNIQF